MGLAGSAAAAVLLLAVLSAGQMYTGVVAESHVRAARLEAELARAMHRVAQSAIAIDNVGWAATPNPIPILPPEEGDMHINLTNTGGVALNTSRTTVVMNGTAFASGTFTRKTVDGLATNVWAPNQTLWLTIHVPQGFAYTNVWVSAETGATAAHRE